jgi:hypothetical protein
MPESKVARDCCSSGFTRTLSANVAIKRWLGDGRFLLNPFQSVIKQISPPPVSLPDTADRSRLFDVIRNKIKAILRAWRKAVLVSNIGTR